VLALDAGLEDAGIAAQHLAPGETGDAGEGGIDVHDAVFRIGDHDGFAGSVENGGGQAVFRLQAGGPGAGGHGFEQGAGLEGLEHVAVDADLDGVEQGAAVAVGGDDDDRCRRALGLDLPGQGETVPVGHDDVGNDQVRLVPAEQLQALVAVGRFPQGAHVAAEDPAAAQRATGSSSTSSTRRPRKSSRSGSSCRAALSILGVMTASGGP